MIPKIRISKSGRIIASSVMLWPRSLLMSWCERLIWTPEIQPRGPRRSRRAPRDAQLATAAAGSPGAGYLPRQNVDHGLDRVRDATRKRREDADGQEADHSQDDAVLGHRLTLLAREPSAEVLNPLRIRHVRFTSPRQLERVAVRAERR